MIFLRRIFIVLLLFCTIAFVISLFLPSNYTVKKQIIAQADLATSKNFLTSKIEKDSLFSFEEYETSVVYDLTDAPDGIELDFTFNIHFGFNPITKFFGLFDREKWSKEIHQQLTLLKDKLEDLPKIHKVNVTVETFAKPIWFISIRDTILQNEMNNIHGKTYETIHQFIHENQLTPLLSPITIYHSWSDTLVDIEIGLPIEEPTISIPTPLQLNSIAAGDYVTATHYGSYDRLPETYFGINEWMRKNKVIVTGMPIEMYLTDPASDNNPNHWETAIYFPIESLKNTENPIIK